MTNISKTTPKEGDYGIFNVDFSGDISRKDPATAPREPYGRDNFPLHVFPPVVREMLEDARRVYGWSAAFGANGVLSTMTAAVGWSIVVKDSRIFSGEIHPPVLFLLNVGISASGKSPSRRRFINALLKRQSAENENHRNALKIWKQYKELDKKAKSKPSDATKHKTEQLEAQYKALTNGQQIPPDEPFFYPFYLDAGGTTLEALHEIFARRLFLLDEPSAAPKALHGLIYGSDEIKSLIVSKNKYESNIMHALMEWYDSGQMHKATKVSGMTYAENISAILTGDIQPSVAARSIYTNENTDNGFVQRVFSAIQESTPQQTPITEPAPTSPPNEQKNLERWSNMVNVVFDHLPTLMRDMMPANAAAPHKGKSIKLSDEAFNIYEDFVRWVDMKCKDIGSEYPEDWRISAIGKTKTAVLRLALILQVLDYCDRRTTARNLESASGEKWYKEIQPNFIINAVALVDYYMNVNNHLANPDKTIESVIASSAHRKWFDSLPDEFSIESQDEAAAVFISRAKKYEIVKQLVRAGLVRKKSKGTYLKQ